MSTVPRPKIVVLDGFTLNPGDLDWGGLREIGDLTVYDRTPVAETVSRAAGAEILLTNKAPIRAADIAQLPALRYIGVLATGWNVVDVDAARARSIPVANVPGYGTASVAQLVFALILELTHRTGHHAQTVRDGRWAASTDFCYWDFPLVELAGKTMGIVGFGAIGKAVAAIAGAFGMKVIVSTRTAQTVADIEFVPVDEVFRRADVVTLHCPLTTETQGLVNAQRIASMKPGAFLINTGRGALVVENELAAALDSGRLAGAGLDVLSVEPPLPGNPLPVAKNCLITPHIAWATRAARERLMTIAVANVRSFLAGSPQNVVAVP
ncbi:MAG: D-2-hydroxyacid dehydrogenase [Verrucomicrobiota bacterium]|nr:D-2-hydroxyacid dehydrogenase [Verrucomicrobiota bacterium]